MLPWQHILGNKLGVLLVSRRWRCFHSVPPVLISGCKLAIFLKWGWDNVMSKDSIKLRWLKPLTSNPAWMLNLHYNGPFIGHNSCVVSRAWAVKRPFLWERQLWPQSLLHLLSLLTGSQSLSRQNKDLIDVGSSNRPTVLSWLDKPLIKRPEEDEAGEAPQESELPSKEWKCPLMWNQKWFSPQTLQEVSAVFQTWLSVGRTASLNSVGLHFVLYPVCLLYYTMLIN